MKSPSPAPPPQPNHQHVVWELSAGTPFYEITIALQAVTFSFNFQLLLRLSPNFCTLGGRFAIFTFFWVGVGGGGRGLFICIVFHVNSTK
jgi:hypothetical protein